MGVAVQSDKSKNIVIKRGSTYVNEQVNEEKRQRDGKSLV